MPLIGLAAVGVVPMFYGIVLLIENVYLVLKPMGQERALLSFGLLAGQLLILLFGIYYVISAFYFSRDLEFLIPLPLRPARGHGQQVRRHRHQRVPDGRGRRPAGRHHAGRPGAGRARAIGSTRCWSTWRCRSSRWRVVSLAVVAMMRFINVSRKKDALILVGSLLLIGLSLCVQIGLRPVGRRDGGPEASAAAVAAFFTSPDSLLNRVGAIFPPGIWATKAVAGGFSGEGLANLALLLGVSIALFAGDGRPGREALLPRPRRARRDDGQEAAADARRDVAARLVGAAGRARRSSGGSGRS